MLSFSVVIVQAQGYNTTNWKFSNPKQFGFSIFDVDYFDNNNVIAVGSDGGIAKSTDGGTNWTYGPFTYINQTGFQVKNTFNDVHYITATTAYAVGNGGLMAKTTDGGATWSFVANPLFPNNKNINTVWFLDANKGYIGGQWNNSTDSLPKIYVTLNGGSTWDSIAPPPSNGVTRVGYINNVNAPSFLVPVESKIKEIMTIQFLNNNLAYICGSATNVNVRHNAVNSACALTGSTTTTNANAAPMLWKFENGVMTDYSLTKERLGYDGVTTANVLCNTRYATITPQVQTYKAMNIINDTTVVLISFNNNVVVKVNTGKNDSTLNINAPGVYEKGKYELLNFTNPPLGQPSIPPVNPIYGFSNPLNIIKTASGKLYTGTAGNAFFAEPGLLYTSVDTGRSWIPETPYPQVAPFNQGPFTAQAIDFAPNGKLLVMGSNGAVGDSVPGSTWQSNYISIPVGSGYSKIEFADCNNGIAAGGSSITVTEDGGATWINKARIDFGNSGYSINGMTYPSLDKTYFAVSNGQIYFSPDKGTTLDPVYTDFSVRMYDVDAVGNDSVWAVGYITSPSASRTSKIYRSTDGGQNWSTYSGIPVGVNGQYLSDIEFPTHLIGYAAGTRDTIWKTTDGGVTWNKLPLPFPGVTPQISYTDMFALDANTVFLTGNGFPRKVVIKTTDGGATWTDISNNITTLGGGNLNGIVMHDVDNGYVVSPGGYLFKTNDGGANWTLDLAPIGTIFTSMAFAPKKVPAAISMANRKLFVSGDNLSGAPMMQYGNPANINVNATETITNASCTSPNGGAITVNASGAIAPYMYSINGGTFQSSNVFTGLTQGPKTITITDAFCGSLTKTVTVGFNDNLTLTTNNDTTVCAGAPVQMRATSAATSYTWSPAGGLSATNISNPIATVNSNAAYTVTASLNGCVRTKTVNITIKPNPVINAGPDKTIVDGDQVALNGSSANTPASISWAPGGSIISGISTFTPVVKPNVTTTYTLTVQDMNGCTSTDNAVVNVIPYCVKVMDAFTPNGDGTNDRWLVTNGSACTSKISVTVFNRYGGKVYQNDNYQNNWEGTYDGKKVADGTYYYVVIYRLINGQNITLKGDVTILR